MKTLLKHTLLSVLSLSLLLIFTGTAFSQDGEEESPPNPMVELAFMKQTDGTYLDVEQKMWKPVHQERINRGELAAWYLMRVRYPQGSEAMYNYVTVNVYNDPAKQLKKPGANYEEILKKVHPDVSMEDFGTKTDASRDMKWVGLWAFIADAVPGPEETPSEFINVNFFTVEEGNFDAYVQMETEVYKPLHAAAVEAGARKDWSLWVKASPRGTAHGTTHITVDTWGSWEDMTGDSGVNMEELFKKVHPDKDMAEVWEKMSKLRSTTRSETWQLVDYVNSKSE